MRIKRLILEMLIVCALACACGLTANAFHPDGVVLARNYFKAVPIKPATSPPERPPVVEVNESTPAAVALSEVTSPLEVNDVTAQEIPPVEPAVVPPPVEMQESVESNTDPIGLNLADFDFAFGAWSAMQAGDPTVVFVDARKAEAYEDSHITGAVLIDHYRLERYLPALQERLEAAQVILVYCAGDCEDSRYLATALVYDHGFPNHKLFLYEGGMADWTQRQQPVTQGAQP
jgi:rhodanese-related sulfurtransferase